jgi:hypothetical protein
MTSVSRRIPSSASLVSEFPPGRHGHALLSRGASTRTGTGIPRWEAVARIRERGAQEPGPVASSESGTDSSAGQRTS